MENKFSDVSIFATKQQQTPNMLNSSDLLVRRSDEYIAKFDCKRIVDALVRETGIDQDLAVQIGDEIQILLYRSGIANLSSSLIRSLVDAKLIEHGLEKEFRAHSRLGVPLYDVEKIIHQPKRGTTTPMLSPEGTSLLLAEAIKREYAILSVFSDPVATAHLIGDIYIQDIGAIDRPHSLIQSVDSVKRYGITTPQGFPNWKPARHPEVLIAHLVKFSAALQGYVNGPIEWDVVNYSLAPYIEKLSTKAIKQLAQSLIFELSSPSMVRGGNLPICTLHLDWEIPSYLKDRPAIGPGGEITGYSYSDYAKPAKTLLKAIFEAYLESNELRLPFGGARPILHVTNDMADSLEGQELLEIAARVAVNRGGIYLAFDRNPQESFYSRYGVPFESSLEKAETTEWCASVFQSVSINLPRAAHSQEGTEIFQEITRLMEVAAQAHLEKRIFLEKLMALGDKGPLALLTVRRQGNPFLKLSRTTHWICPIGLNELVFCATGKEMHESNEAIKFGCNIVDHLVSETKRLTEKHKTRFVLAESFSEMIPSRLAQLDAQFFQNQDLKPTTSALLKKGELYYTNGAKLSSSAEINLWDLITTEGKIQRHHILNSVSNIWMKDYPVSSKNAATLSLKALKESEIGGLLFSPEFTVCLDCEAIIDGLGTNCIKCGSSKIDGIAAFLDRYSLTSGWTRNMLQELNKRYRQNINSLLRNNNNTD